MSSKNRIDTKLILLVLLCGLLLWLWWERPTSSQPWHYRNANGEFLVDTADTGQIVKWSHKGRTLMDASSPAPLSLTLEDGTEARFTPQRVGGISPDGLTLYGQFTGGTFKVPASITYKVTPGAETIRIALESDHPAAETEVKHWEWPLPFQLERHKKVYFHGDHGLDWESRHTYQFHLSTDGKLLEQPDFNEWRWFVAEHLTPEVFRIWKSESDTTAPLVMQEGKRIAPYLQVYDRQGGVTVEYPQLAESGQRALRVDASGGGTVSVAFRTPSGAELQAPTPFGTRHEIRLSAHLDDKSRLARRSALNAAFIPSAPVATELEEPSWIRDTLPGKTPLVITGGYPFARGTVHDAATVGVLLGGNPVPVQAAPLGFWPDGSLKWVSLTFPVPPTGTDRSTSGNQNPRITFRDASSLPLTITTSSTANPSPATRLEAHTLPDGSVEVLNGPLTTRFATGREWFDAELDGQPLFSAPPTAYVRYKRDPERHLPFAPAPEGGKTDTGHLLVEKVELEEAGPLRAVVRIEGMSNGETPTRFILRATQLAGEPRLVLTHTTEFLFTDPRTTFLSGLGLELPLAGLKEASPALFQESYDARKTTGDAIGGGAMEASLAGGVRFHGLLRKMAETAPKAITRQGETIRFELWPTQAPPMDVRRYSNRPHRGQGESTSEDPGWVEKQYYPNAPFAGLSRTHEIAFSFHREAEAPKIATVSADFESPPLLYPGWETCLTAKVLLPVVGEQDWPQLWQNRNHLARFWLHHRDLHRWYGFWNYGDFRHRFRAGYGWVTSPEALAAALANPEHQLPPDAPRILDSTPANDWGYDNGRWGWSNSEGLANLFLQQEYLRTGNRVLYSTAEAMARYCRDVVLRHHGQWLGLGTRHGVQPWSDGNHEERQTTSTEFRLHYFLSGDARTREVADKLYHHRYNASSVRNEAAHSGRWGGLFFHHELTGSPEEAEQLRRYAHTFIAPDGAGMFLNPQLHFPGPQVAAPGEALNAARMFFACYGGFHYLLEYQQTFQDEPLRQALLAMARNVITAPPRKQGGSPLLWLLPSVGFAAREAPDPQPFRTYLLECFGIDRYRSHLYQSVTANPAHWSGPTGYMTGNMPGVFFYANWMPYLTSTFPNDPIWSPEIAAALQTTEKEGASPAPAADPWLQNGFDHLISPQGTYQP